MHPSHHITELVKVCSTIHVTKSMQRRRVDEEYGYIHNVLLESDVNHYEHARTTSQLTHSSKLLKTVNNR
jgi:hypothetical protein